MTDRTVILPVKMNENDRKALVKFADDRGTNASALIRDIVNAYMEQQSDQPFHASVKERGGDRRSKSYRKKAV